MPTEWCSGLLFWEVIYQYSYKIYTFCPLERIATANLENGIELETIGIIFNWDISTCHSHPSATENIA